MGGMAAGICLLLVMAFSSQAMEAASQAARVFASGVMPALLPMMVLCRLLPAHANHERSAWRGYAGAVFFSFASGSPASAQRVRDLWGAGALARGALEPLLAACGVMGPMFFTGTLAQWTGLRAGCWVLLLCHWTGALAAAGVVRLAARKQPACRTGAAAAPAPGPAAPRPSLPEAVHEPDGPGPRRLYVSLGTVNNRNLPFYRACAEAFRAPGLDVTMAVGESTDPAALGPLPPHITVRPRVDQLAVLAGSHVFLSHCGMNSVSESLYLGVPLVLFPQQQEQALVARRTAQLGAGLLLKRAAPQAIRQSVLQVLGQLSYTACARAMSADLRTAGGARLGAEKILSAAEKWG